MMKEGIINLLKPAGMTSHDGVQLLRRLTGVKRIGHTGTLDPMAVGVLPLCIGNATRITEYLDLDYKKYRCEMQLGLETDTQDVWGTVICNGMNDIKNIDENSILKALDSFKGTITQLPPNYSAVKVNGKRLYEYARQGQSVEVKPRKVEIKNITIISIDLDKGRVTFDVECSKGTYIRTICQDTGKILGCGAVMSCLIRTASGRFTLEDTVTIEELLALRTGEDIRDEKTGRYLEYARVSEDKLEQYLFEPDYPLVHFGRALVNEERGKWFINGGHLNMSEVRIEKEPEYKDASSILDIREEYKRAYNIYLEQPNQKNKKSILFLGVAFYNTNYKKLVAGKVFLSNNKCDF